MATVTRQLPARPHLDVPKREARELLADWRESRPAAFERIRNRHDRCKGLSDAALAAAAFKLNDAQRVIAGEYGYANWPALKQRINAASAAGELQSAIHRDDRDAVVAILEANPEMLHLPVWSGNWGPPMSHAANLGRLAIVQAVAALGARDHQHAFERAVLQGQIETARWLHAHGAKPVAGIIMGTCETLNAKGFSFLLEIGAPLTARHGDRLAPLAHVLKTYARNPAGKHAILERFVRQGYELPETPIMAFHRGDLTRLRQYLRDDPKLLERRFTLREIYPAECGCGGKGGTGLHWTPIDGATLLHLAVDFREREIFDWLLSERIDVDARATVDGDGFGGHTALFNAVVSGPGNDATFAEALLRQGASRDIRASLRKFLDWCEEPRWHEARNVLPSEWAHTFPDQSWVNHEAFRLLNKT